MLTVAKLKAYGANVEEGVSRCLDSEEFYLELINTVLEDGDPAPLKQALLAKDVNASFEIAHGLKGVYANLSLTPLLTPANELTEILRAKKLPADNAFIDEITAQFDALKALAQ